MSALETHKVPPKSKKIEGRAVKRFVKEGSSYWPLPRPFPGFARRPLLDAIDQQVGAIVLSSTALIDVCPGLQQQIDQNGAGELTPIRLEGGAIGFAAVDNRSGPEGRSSPGYRVGTLPTTRKKVTASNIRPWLSR